MENEMTEAEFLKSYDPNKYQRPSLTTDAIMFGYFGGHLDTLLIQRKNHPFQGWWVFPGGFVEVYEDPDDGVKRELREETGIEADNLIQFSAFGRPDRDPRYHVVTIAYLGIVRPSNALPKADDDAALAAWHPLDDRPRLAFDHEQVLETALERLRREIPRISFATQFLEKGFTGRDIHALYQAVLGAKLDPARFLARLGEVCAKPPTMDAAVKLSKTSLKKFEARLCAWWL